MLSEVEMERETFELPSCEAFDIIEGYNDDYEIIEKTFLGKSRFSITFRMIVRDKITNKYYKVIYGEPISDDGGGYSYFSLVFNQVFPDSVMVIVYE
jgi:hypothetical protein